MANNRVPERWKSIAVWPKGTITTIHEDDTKPDEGDISTDTHLSYEAAQWVCRELNLSGFGGDGKIFPINTFIEPVW